MTEKRTNASDAGYHGRHARRTLHRAEQIAANINGPVRILDVGCNNGITSQYLLDSGVASHVTGIELRESTVDAALKGRDDFTLIEGNIVDIELDSDFDVIVYGAVHHHILRFNGLAAAIDTLQKLVRHCTQHLFFETGQISEGGRWPWQQDMRRHFRTDEEHFFYLLRSVEDQISRFDIIGQFWIHGARRAYLRLDRAREQNVSGYAETLDWPGDAQGPMVRTRGSSNQSLMRMRETELSDSPTRFWTSKSTSRFLKQHVHHPVAGPVEFAIGSQLDASWPVKPEGVTHENNALVFEWLADAKPIREFGTAPADVRRRLADQVVGIHRQARRTSVTLPEGCLLTSASSLRLTDVCDLNLNNLLVTSSNDSEIVRVVDFEQQSTAYRYRNRLHLARTLRTLDQYPGLAARLTMGGWIGIVLQLLRNQFRPLKERIANRQPSAMSLLVADLRSAAGRVLGKLLGVIGLGEH